MSEELNQTAQSAERKFCLSDLRRMLRKDLLGIAQAQPHLWPSSTVGSLTTKTTVKILERVFLEKNSGYRTTAPMPLDTTVFKKRRGGRGASAAKLSLNPQVPVSMVTPNVTSTGCFTNTTAETHDGSAWNSIQGPNPHQEILNTVFTVRLLDKRETPPARVAVDIAVDPAHISQDQVSLGKLKVKTNEVVRLLVEMNTIRGFIKLSTPHHRIGTDSQPFLSSEPGTSLLDTPVSIEYLIASDEIINIMVEYGLDEKQRSNIANSLKRKHEEEDHTNNPLTDEAGGSNPDPSTLVLDPSSIPLHIARKRANLGKANTNFKKNFDDKMKALEWITEQVVAQDGYSLFNHLRGSSKAQNPDIVRLWLFAADICSKYMSKSIEIPNASAKVKIMKTMIWQSLGIRETSLNTMIHAASLVRKYGERGSQTLPEVVTRLNKTVLMNRAAGQMPEGRRSLLEFLNEVDATRSSQ
ncbi:hypothetical protein BDP27DRAFT_1503133 [Rhodocollybia butyracea]|uniref:Uncharacterized protein n=1 Tax=Rhodocollybia butyracea TaxID=206335 RepID=A0A9P5TY72_9AGAR|nr:hypothetical protein BDP27DRAFT_1503133 [Rhodocollybia butyracea]